MAAVDRLESAHASDDNWAGRGIACRGDCRLERFSMADEVCVAVASVNSKPASIDENLQKIERWAARAAGSYFLADSGDPCANAVSIEVVAPRVAKSGLGRSSQTAHRLKKAM